MAAMLLGDLGADVIKIEPPTGERMRNWRDDFVVAANRSKRGLAIDIRDPRAREVVERLVATADVVLHNTRPIAARRLALDEASIRRIRPDVVFCHASSYGPAGACANLPGFDSIFQGMSGWTREIAGIGNEPVSSAVGTLDEQTGTLGALATMLALYHRRRTGVGGSPSVSLLGTATFSTSETLLITESGEVAPYRRLTGDQTGLGPFHRLYPAADGWIAVVATTEARRVALLTVAGVRGPDDLEVAIAQRESVDLLTALAAVDVPAEAVHEFYWFDLFDDPEHRRTGVTVDYEHAEYGRLEQPGGYLSLDGKQALIPRRPPPVTGEHSAEILAELGYEHDEVGALIRAGVVVDAGRHPSSAVMQR